MKNKIFTKKQFKVIIETDEDGFFVANVPALPGCHTQGATLKELMKNVHEVIQLCLEVAKDDPSYRKQIEMSGYEPTFIGVESVNI